MAQRTEQRAQFHQALLKQLEQGGAGAEYLRSRGISAETALGWQLGFAGGRLVIPLSDAAGQTVGFCGRATGNQEPKYRNSSSDLLFQRNGLVFGLDQVSEAIRKGGTALLVEGPLDVIQLHQAGFCHAVACLGTSVSELQLQLLRRQGMKQLLIALDGDKAGQAATEKLLKQLQPELTAGGLSASVVQLPEGEDADGLLRTQGATTIEGLIASARHWLEWRMDRLLAALAADSASPTLVSLQAVEQAGQALVNQLPDGVLRRTAEQRLNAALAGTDSSQESIPAPIPPPALAEPSLPAAHQRLERRVVQLAIHAPQCLFMLTSLPLRDGACRAAFDWVQNTAMTMPPDQLPAALLRLVPQISGATGAVLAQAIAPGADVIQQLHSQPEAEFESLADALDLKPQ
jgi:DNA primase